MEIFRQNPKEFRKYSQFETQNENQNHRKKSRFEPEIKFSQPSSGFAPSNDIRKASSNWSYLIRNCVFQGKPKQALLIYTRNRGIGSVILGAIPLVIKACTSLAMVSLGNALHAESIKTGVEFDVMVGTSLVDMYGKRGDLISSRKMFDSMPQRNVTTWNAMIGGYMRNGDIETSTSLFEEMSIKSSITWNQMIDGFAKRGDMVMAKQLFDRVPEALKTVVTWTIMVVGYASNGEMEAAEEVFEVMPRRNFYVWSSMISGYFKKGEVEKAKAIFDRMNLRNLVNWNSLISGYAQNGFSKEALDAFRRMKVDGFEPDEFTLVSVLSACAHEGFLDAGKEIHEMIIQKRLPLNQFVLNGLVDMYSKCGDLSRAKLVFEEMAFKTKAAWNSLILGFAIHGQGNEALEIFDEMESKGEKPDDITFLAVLSACAHGGFLEEGLEAFSKMEKYGVAASIKHYGCLVDLLGRAGRLEEACNLVMDMPVKPNEKVWGALLGACRIHSDTDTTKRVLEEVEKLKYGSDFSDSAHYVLLSSIFAASEKWEKAEGMRMAFSNSGPPKTAGWSAIMFQNAETNFMTKL